MADDTVEQHDVPDDPRVLKQQVHADGEHTEDCDRRKDGRGTLKPNTMMNSSSVQSVHPDENENLLRGAKEFGEVGDKDPDPKPNLGEGKLLKSSSVPHVHCEVQCREALSNVERGDERFGAVTSLGQSKDKGAMLDNPDKTVHKIRSAKKCRVTGQDRSALMIGIQFWKIFERSQTQQKGSTNKGRASQMKQLDRK